MNLPDPCLVLESWASAHHTMAGMQAAYALASLPQAGPGTHSLALLTSATTERESGGNCRSPGPPWNLADSGFTPGTAPGW